MKFNCNVKTTPEDLKDTVESLIGHRPSLYFSIYKSNNGRYDIIIAPDLKSPEPVIEGKCVLYTDYWRITEMEENKGQIVASEVLENPTWKDILIAVDKIIATGDGCGIFFEGLSDPNIVDGVKHINISIGS